MSKIILGIDPGTNIMGYGVLQVEQNRASYLTHGNCRFSKGEDSVSRLGEILSKTYELLDLYKPHIAAIEAPFFGKNVQSMLKLGRAQGVIMAASLSKGTEVFEYAPRKIKMSITGKGQASKEQVAQMLSNLMVLKDDKDLTLDATDALAVAFCHFLQMGTLNEINISDQGSRKKKKISTKGDWSSFLKQNPEREF